MRKWGKKGKLKEGGSSLSLNTPAEILLPLIKPQEERGEGACAVGGGQRQRYREQKKARERLPNIAKENQEKNKRETEW